MAFPLSQRNCHFSAHGSNGMSIGQEVASPEWPEVHGLPGLFQLKKSISGVGGGSVLSGRMAMATPWKGVGVAQLTHVLRSGQCSAY